MLHGPPRRRRARPVADAPIDALLAGAEDLAKGWLLALLEQAPLAAAGSIPAAEIAREGPRICEAVVRALASDADLRRLEPGGALEPLVSRAGSVAGAADPSEAARAVDALGAVVWSAIKGEIRAEEAELLSELAERLALVTEQVRAATLRGPAAGAAGSYSAPTDGDARTYSAPAEPVRREDALWVEALEDEIARSRRTGASLSLLLAELEDAQRVGAADAGTGAAIAFGHFAQAVRSVVRRDDILAHETESRAWIIARDTSRRGARALGERIAAAVELAPSWRGAPMRASVGVAVLDEEASDGAGLIEAAEESLFAASASGVAVAERS